MTSKKNGGEPEEQLTFEAAYQRLEQTVQALESGGLTLDEATGLYAEGARWPASATSCSAPPNSASPGCRPRWGSRCASSRTRRGSRKRKKSTRRRPLPFTPFESLRTGFDFPQGERRGWQRPDASH